MPPAGIIVLAVLHLALSRNPGHFDHTSFNTKWTLDARNSILPFTKTTEKNGYVSEPHEVITEDGYILRVFRIAKAKKCKEEKKKPPVILMHGLLLSSDVFFDSGTEAGLAYLLADACFDIWVGNQRGNYYSRRHIELNPDKDIEFWQFSVDEIGVFDIPATIDYVLEKAGAKQVNYIGFSQGSGTFYIMCSERPGYCEKAQLLISLAPASRHLNAKSAVFRSVTETMNQFSDILTELGFSEVFGKGGPAQELVEFLCANASDSEKFCASIQVDTEHEGSITQVALKVIRSHFPAGTSLQNMARYGQSVTSNKFVKYDYGKEKNLDFYGRDRPPTYNLSAVSVPVVVLYGRNDGIVDVRDVRWLARKLPNVLELYEVEDPLWNHFDMVYSRYAPERIFPKIMEYLSRYVSHD